MKRCFIVFSEPGNQVHGVHFTIDGAVHSAGALGAATMPDGRSITVIDVHKTMESEASILLRCALDDAFERIRIERHAIFV